MGTVYSLQIEIAINFYFMKQSILIKSVHVKNPKQMNNAFIAVIRLKVTVKP